MQKKLIAAAIILAATTPAFAQFPPPGVYLCVDMNGASFGVLTLQVAGDYTFSSDATIGGTGQIASSGNSVNAVSGPLADIDLTGSFTTNDKGEATFTFTTMMGSILCGLPAN